MEFSRQESWSGVPFPSPGDLPKPGVEPASLASPALAGRFFTSVATWGTPFYHITLVYLNRVLEYSLVLKKIKTHVNRE